MDYEEQTISLHLIGNGDVELKVSDLTDDQLRELWVNARVDVARLALRERTGIDISKGVDDLTGDDARWYIEWRKRQETKTGAETTDSSNPGGDTQIEPSELTGRPIKSPIPAREIAELDFTGMSDEDKKNAIDFLLTSEEVGRLREKMPAGKFPGWGEPYVPTFRLSEADIAWAKNEENASVLFDLKIHIEQLGLSEEDKQTALKYVRQMPLSEATQFVLNFISANPLLETEFYMRLYSLEESVADFRTMATGGKVSFPAAFNDVPNTVTQREKKDFSESYTFDEYLREKHPNIALDDLVKLPEHKKKVARDQKLYARWVDGFKDQVYDQVLARENVQIRYNSKGKVSKNAFALFAQAMAIVGDLIPPVGSEVIVTIVRPDWIKGITGSCRRKGITTIGPAGARIHLSEDLFGSDDKKEADGYRPDLPQSIRQVLEQYGFAIYAFVLRAGLRKNQSATELEDIFKNKFDVAKRESNGSSEFSMLFRDYFTHLLNASMEKDAVFEAFLARAVNSGYAPDIDFS